MNPVLLPLLTSSWLCGAALFDLKKRAVPNWLTLPVLAASLAWGFLRGEWPVSTLVLLLILVSDLPFFWGLAAAAGLVALYQLLPVPSFTGAASLESLLLLGIWTTWKLGKTGGADAKVLLALTLAFGPGICLVVLVTGGIAALIARLRHQESLPYMLPVLAGSILYFVLKPLLLT